MSDSELRSATGTGTSGTGIPSASQIGQQGAELARNVSDQARSAVSGLGGQAQQMVSGTIERQIKAGLEVADAIAKSVRAAADDLEKTSPQAASLMRMGGDRIEDFADEFRGQSFEDLSDRAIEFSRSNPAIVFGAALIGGLMVARVVAGTSGAVRQAVTRSMHQQGRGGRGGQGGMRGRGGSQGGQRSGSSYGQSAASQSSGQHSSGSGRSGMSGQGTGSSGTGSSGTASSGTGSSGTGSSGTGAGSGAGRSSATTTGGGYSGSQGSSGVTSSTGTGSSPSTGTGSATRREGQTHGS